MNFYAPACSDLLSNRSVPESNALELLICCSSAHTERAAAERIRKIAQESVDWSGLLHLADEHGLTPLLHRSLQSSCPELVPPNTLRQLEQVSNEAIRACRHLAEELLELLYLLDQHGIPVIPFKGPTLGFFAYGCLTLRPFRDLDLFVHREHMETVKALLINQGYLPYPPMTAKEEERYIALQVAYGFFHSKKQSVVELHWALTHRAFSFPLSPETIWKGSQEVTFLGLTVKRFSTEDLLLFLFVHGAKHGWERLVWLSDVAHVIHSHPDLDWDVLLSSARRTRSGRMVFLGVLLAKHLLHAEVPDQIVRKATEDRTAASLASQFIEQLFNGEAVFSGSFGRPVFHIKVREALRDKARNALNVVYLGVTPNEKDRGIIELPARFSILYYLLRPIRLIRDVLN